MSLVTTNDIYNATSLSRFGIVGKPVAWFLKKATRLDKLNNIYNRGKHLETAEFLSYLIDDLNVDYEIHVEDLKRIPKSGPFILISNHPLGALDGIILMHMMSKIRPDFRIMGNFLLHKIVPLQQMVIPVNPFESRREVYSSLNGMREVLRTLQDNGCIGIFPAGEVSYRNENGHIIDREWQDSAIKLIKKAKVPVIPMFFRAKNSEIFYQIAKMHPDLQTAMLPGEMVKKRTRPIQIRVGKPILLKQQNEFSDVNEFKAFLRKKTYMLSSYYNKKKSFTEVLKNPSQLHLPKISSKSKVKDVVPETDTQFLIDDLNKLKKDVSSLLFTSNNYECYFSTADKIPNVMREIGRLREITFREIGEGTNLEIDLDKYDNHYHHLFLWDKEANKIVGAYRMALGAEVYQKYGVKGFYINELFNFDPEIHPLFSKCIEMGRAFVSSEYQQKPMPLFLLWRGIIHVTLRNSEQQFIIGGVSISDQFSDFSKSLMIEFMKSHYYDSTVAQYVRPKKEYKVKLSEEDKQFIFDETEADLNKFDKLIDELEPNMLRLPVLIKKYVKQNAKVIAFNVDPNFNDAIDGLMYIRVSDIPDSTVKPVLEDIQAELDRKIQSGKFDENQ
ncbi:GNAT family N-acyltransferase [Faecalibacter bovis]|uniref:Lysophospholipid acyltransferase family protein n=1 Tax=Faecalibacter bovis TaxID=2898187 RepID=A0ABX7XFE8_9FLAO|nr:lysophospholipid acyltransferase family protein [Faecalibacter bovis]QTV06549.1 lysophospholipid acyltransferase family protein [Faecalibacter bovis]